jgi:hypothetical protein
LAVTISEYIAAARSPPRSEPANSHAFLLCISTHNRKNFLFAGSDTGGERAAAIYTLVRTAVLNGQNPEAYLKDILSKIAAGHPINRIAELLPWKQNDDASIEQP